MLAPQVLGVVATCAYLAGVLSVVGGLAAVGIAEPRRRRQRAVPRRADRRSSPPSTTSRATGQLWQHVEHQRRRVRARLCHRQRPRHCRRSRHGEQRRRQAGDAALDVGPLCDAHHRARAAVHSLARHRHLVEGAGGDPAGVLSGHHQHRGRTAHDQRAADRDAALVRRDASGRSSSRCRCRRRCRSSWPGSRSASAAA